MILFRLLHKKYSETLFASGKSGRWNLADEKVIYTSESRSLAALGRLTKAGGIISDEPPSRMLLIEVPDDARFFSSIGVSKLPGDWRNISAYSELQKTGSQWYHSQASLILKVPSAVITAENNFIINTLHPDFKKNVRIKQTEDFPWDKRLLRTD